jgi:hypothetical protein
MGYIYTRQDPPFLTWVLYGVQWLASNSCRFTPEERDPQCILDRRLGGHQSLSGRCGVKKYIFLLATIKPGPPIE